MLASICNIKCSGSGSAWIHIKLKGRIRIRIKVISWIRIRISLQMASQNVWNMSLFEHFFKVLILYLEARIRIRIRNKVKGRIQIRIKVTSRIRVRIRITLMQIREKIAKIAGFRSGYRSESVIKCTDPRIRTRLKMSRIRNTGDTTGALQGGSDKSGIF